ncbi:MAG: hypothetical protein R6V10_15385 [bacterium]
MQKDSWIQLRDFHQARVLFLLPCNAAACVGNYFRAESYTNKNWNTWREADQKLRDLRTKGEVVLAAVDSSTLETQPEDARGAIVFETEMDRVINPEGEDWGAPSWRWFRPSVSGKWTYLEELSRALIPGVERVESLGFEKVMALVNPRGYFLALAAAVAERGLIDEWTLFRVPPHPRYLIPSVRLIAPLVRAAVQGHDLPGGIHVVPDFAAVLRKTESLYRDPLPTPWRFFGHLPSDKTIRRKWRKLTTFTERKI